MSEKITALIEEVKAMTVLELSELVKVFLFVCASGCIRAFSIRQKHLFYT